MSINAKLALELTVAEIITGNAPAAAPSNKTITHNLFNVTRNLPDGGCPVTKTAAFRVTLSSGAATVNLAALTGSNGAAVDLTGLKVQAILFNAPTTNANVITIVPGASNGIDLFGVASSLSILPGQAVLLFLNEAAPDVASGDRTLDLAGTGAQVIDVILVAG